MSGLVIPVLEKRRLEFAHLAAGTQQTITLCPAIEVADFYYIQLWLRVHARSFSGNQLVTLTLYNTLPSEDDPRQFTQTSSFASLTCSSGSPSSVPGLLTVSASNPGPFLKLQLDAFQDTAVAGTFYAELSAVLLGRPS